MREPHPPCPNRVFTLVHGTWAYRYLPFTRAAVWTDEDATMSRVLRERFPSCKIVRPRWSGGNTFRARRTAVTALRDSLMSARDERGSSLHFVIAHSHGGTVVSTLLNDPSVARSVDGVIFLATPFPSLKMRSNLMLARYALPAVPFACVVLVSQLFRMWLGINPMSASWGNVAAWAIDGLALVLILNVAGTERYIASAQRFVARHSPPPLGTHSALVVRHPSDEATGVLVTSHTLGSTANLALVSLVRLYVVMGTLALALGPATDPADPLWLLAAVAPWIGPMTIVAIALVVAIIVSIGAFDYLAFFYSAAVAVSPEVAPIGFSSIYQAPSSGHRSSHAAVHSDPDTVVAMCNWIQGISASNEDK